MAVDLQALWGSIVRMMAGNPHIDFRNLYIRKDGGIVHILWSARWYDEERVRVGVDMKWTPFFSPPDRSSKLGPGHHRLQAWVRGC